MVKKLRGFWMDDEHYKKLMDKVKKKYQGKGALERYMEEIARNEVLLIPSGIIHIKIETAK